MLQYATILILYRNYRKSSEAHCGQHNQKVATQTEIQCIFQFLHEPVNEEQSYNDITRRNILYRVLPQVLMTVSCIPIIIRNNFRRTSLLMLCVLHLCMNFGKDIEIIFFYMQLHQYIMHFFMNLRHYFLVVSNARI